eukprot:gene33218-53177_t
MLLSRYGVARIAAEGGAVRGTAGAVRGQKGVWEPGAGTLSWGNGATWRRPPHAPRNADGAAG